MENLPEGPPRCAAPSEFLLAVTGVLPSSLGCPDLLEFVITLEMGRKAYQGEMWEGVGDQDAFLFISVFQELMVLVNPIPHLFFIII